MLYPVLSVASPVQFSTASPADIVAVKPLGVAGSAGLVSASVLLEGADSPEASTEVTWKM